MGKFTRAKAVPTGASPIKTVGTLGDIATFGGVAAKSRDAKSDLFLFAAANMVGEDTYYEGASARDQRFRDLVHQVAVEDFDWLVRFARYLRKDMFMRSASIVLAAEAVAVRLKSKNLPESYHTNRQIIDFACERLDEPGEMIAYWHSRYGRAIPQPVKRGLSDALARLANQYSAMKYDGVANSIRLGDVIEIVHPKALFPWQADLFAYLLDRRHHSTNIRVSLERLPVIESRCWLESMPPENRRDWLRNGGNLKATGATWEWLSGWLPGDMDAEAWEAVIPSMGYMALLRNLRNFDDKGISASMAEEVIKRLSDPAEVARSMQFPFRFYSAHKAAGDSMNWGRALTKALDLATGNIPELPGRTLIITDSSGSMGATLSAKSTMRYEEAAAVFAAAVARRNAGRVDLVQFADSAKIVPFSAGASVLSLVGTMSRDRGRIGYGTNINSALSYDRGHDRIIVFSDMQVQRYATWPNKRVYLWNLAGYAASIAYGTNTVELGGMSDKAFSMIPIIESGRTADWPF